MTPPVLTVLKSAGTVSCDAAPQCVLMQLLTALHYVTISLANSRRCSGQHCDTAECVSWRYLMFTAWSVLRGTDRMNECDKCDKCDILWEFKYLIKANIFVSLFEILVRFPWWWPRWPTHVGMRTDQLPYVAVCVCVWCVCVCVCVCVCDWLCVCVCVRVAVCVRARARGCC